MASNASLIFDSDGYNGIQRPHDVNRLYGGRVIEKTNPTYSDAFMTQFRAYVQTSSTEASPDDVVYQAFLDAAIETVEGYIDKSLGAVTYEDAYRYLYRSTMLSESPVSAILSITYNRSGDDGGTIIGDIPPEGSDGNASFDVSPSGELRFSPLYVQWLNSNIYTVTRFLIRYKGGLAYANSDNFPAAIKVAIWEIAAAMDWGRGQTDEGMLRKSFLSPKVMSLLNPYKRVRIA